MHADSLPIASLPMVTPTRRVVRGGHGGRGCRDEDLRLFIRIQNERIIQDTCLQFSNPTVLDHPHFFEIFNLGAQEFDLSVCTPQITLEATHAVGFACIRC